MATNPEEEARRITEDGLRQVESGARSFNSATEAAASGMGTAAKDIGASRRDTDAAIQQAEQGFTRLGASVLNFGRALSSSDASLSKYAGAIDEAGSGLAMLATAAFGPLGLVLGFVVKAMTSLMSAELKQTDKILGNFEKLGELGAAAQMTSGEIEGMFNNAGFSTINGQSQMIVKTITSLGSDLTKLGATSIDGVKTFTQLAAFNTSSLEEQQTIRNQFNNLGISQEKLLNAQAGFMKEQGALGFGRKQVDKKLVDQSLGYTKNLSMLSALTGESADAIKASRAKDLEDFAFNVSLRQLGDDEAGKKQRDMVQNMATVIGSKVDDQAKKAFMSVFANGAAVTSEAIALSTRTQGQFVTWTNDFKSGKLSPEGFINKLNESGDAMLQSMGAALKSNAALRESMGMGPETVMNTATTMAEGAMDATMKEINKKMNQKDVYVDFANTTKNLADQFAKMMDELLKLIQKPLMDAFKWLIEATMTLIKGFATSRLAKAFGIDFSPLLLKMNSVGSVVNEVGDLVEKLEQEKKNKDKLFGGTPQNVWEKLKEFRRDFRGNDQRIADLEEQLKIRAQEITDRGLIYKGNPFHDSSTKPAETTTAPKVPSTASSQEGTMDGYKPRRSAEQQESVPKYKFGGITGDGFSDMSKKITGGGIFDGPTSGYRKTLPKNKNFAVVPLPSGDRIPVTFQGGMDTEAKTQEDLNGNKANPLADMSIISDTMTDMMTNMMSMFKNDMSMASKPADLTGNKDNPLTETSQLTDMMTDMMSKFKNNNEEEQSFSTVSGPTTTNKTTGVLQSVTDKLDILLDRIRLNNNLQTELLDHARG
jgi:hypothetical protein